jgi:hypothetical protein
MLLQAWFYHYNIRRRAQVMALSVTKNHTLLYIFISEVPPRSYVGLNTFCLNMFFKTKLF